MLVTFPVKFDIPWLAACGAVVALRRADDTHTGEAIRTSTMRSWPYRPVRDVRFMQASIALTVLIVSGIETRHDCGNQIQ
jgi:hypothetical protein